MSAEDIIELLFIVQKTKKKEFIKYYKHFQR